MCAHAPLLAVPKQELELSSTSHVVSLSLGPSWEVTLGFLQLNCNLLLRAPSRVSMGQGGQLDLDGKGEVQGGTYQPNVGPALPGRVRATLYVFERGHR